LERLGNENLDALEATIDEERIACGFERSGSIDVATAPWHLHALAESASLAQRLGLRSQLLDGPAVRARVSSPTYLGGLYRHGTTGLVDPARLAWGLASAIERRAGHLFERSPAVSVARDGRGLRVSTSGGAVVADRVVLATSAFSPLVPRIRRYVLPVYDYVLATRPLDERERASLGWLGREGLADAGNLFHYYRLTPDDRVLFGGYDAVYYFNNGLAPSHDVRPRTFERLARHFVTTFPQLEGVSFTHAWGGAIDTCSRFCAFFGVATAGRVAYAAGFTGLGVGASRFAADVLVDLVTGADTERTSLAMVRDRPFPFPPEPLRSAVVGLTRWSLQQSDASEGRRNAWLRVLDRMGIGFAS
ncbi:MAG: NAD(P)/FAD-dependent oxidoreductase, partial [Acidimicrobiales bacterium]